MSGSPEVRNFQIDARQVIHEDHQSMQITDARVLNVIHADPLVVAQAHQAVNEARQQAIHYAQSVEVNARQQALQYAQET